MWTYWDHSFRCFYGGFRSIIIYEQEYWYLTKTRCFKSLTRFTTEILAKQTLLFYQKLMSSAGVIILIQNHKLCILHGSQRQPFSCLIHALLWTALEYGCMFHLILDVPSWFWSGNCFIKEVRFCEWKDHSRNGMAMIKAISFRRI